MDEESLGECVGTAPADVWKGARQSAWEARRRTRIQRVLLIVSILLAAAGVGLGLNISTALVIILATAVVGALFGRRVVIRPRGPEFDGLLKELSAHGIESAALARLLLSSGVIVGPLWFRARRKDESLIAVHLLSLDSPEYRSSWHWFLNGI